MDLGCFWPRLVSRAVLGITRSGFGWPTRARALALTALTVEKVFFLARFPGICAYDGYEFPRGRRNGSRLPSPFR